MDRAAAIVLCIVSFIMLCEVGEAIKCFNCNSLSTKECADPMDWSKVTYTECSLDNIQTLMKRASHGLEQRFGDFIQNTLVANASALLPNMKFSCQKMDVVDAEGNTFNVRSCIVTQADNTDSCGDMTKGMQYRNSKVAFCGLCDGNLCNGASYSSVSQLMLSAAIVLLYYLTP